MSQPCCVIEIENSSTRSNLSLFEKSVETREVSIRNEDAIIDRRKLIETRGGKERREV